MLRTNALLMVSLLSAVAVACSDGTDPNTGNEGGAGGNAGTAGSAGSGGSATAGTGGSSAGAGGSGGSGGATGGTAGQTTGGSGGSQYMAYPEVPYPPENQPTEDKELLGKILFWEEQVSSDDTMACGTCHRAAAGGSDPRASQAGAIHPGPDGTIGTADDRRGAQGIKRCTDSGGVITYKNDPVFGATRQVTGRKPPTYLDAMFNRDNFWDGRARSQFIDPDTGAVAIAAGGALESQSVGPPLADAEMACENRAWPSIHAKLTTAQPLALAHDIPADMKQFIAKYPTYPQMFEAVYGTQEINTKRIAFAIATHERRLTSNQTPWDRWNAGDATAMTEAQIRGFTLFMTTARCNLCHAPPLFSDVLAMGGTDIEFHNLGFIEEDASFDNGREKVTMKDTDRFKVKTPTLRNVGLREAGGLLHTGSGPGADLQSVMEAYKNIPFPNSPNIDSTVGGPAGPADPLPINAQDIADIIDFMRNALTDPRVKNEQAPFDRPKLGSEP
ncbi:MAG: hypothetical protein KC766_33510 [Myxococcales bacterium]|nr:hypothetical protein [Myxococcales bacterium]